MGKLTVLMGPRFCIIESADARAELELEPTQISCAAAISYFVFTEIMLYSARLTSPRGAYARSSRYVGWGCGGRVGSQRGFGHADERPRCGREIVWAWSPGAEAKSAMTPQRVASTTGTRTPIPGASTYKR